MSRLITASLVGSIDWYLHCPVSWKEKAMTDLQNQLARVYADQMPTAIELGIKFENTVYEHANNENITGSDHYKWFISECKGGEFQRKTKCYLTIDGYEYCLYGKIDVWYPDIIKDIKTTSNYKGPQHYLDSIQHKIYCYSEKIKKFRYIVGEFDENQHLIGHHSIDWTTPDWDDLKIDLVRRIKGVISFLEMDDALFNLYTTKFSMY